MNRVAAGVQPKIITRDFPARAELVEQMLGRKPVAHHFGQRFFDGVGLRFKPRQRQVWRERPGKTRHAAGHIERRRARAGVGVTRRHHQNRRDAHRETHARRIEPAHARARGSGGKQHRLPVLMRQRPRCERHADARRHFVARHQRRQQRFAIHVSVLAHGQHTGQDLHRRLARGQPQPFAQFNRTARDAVKQRRGARVVRGGAACIDGRTGTGGRSHTLTQRRHFRAHRAGEDHANRVEQHQLGVLAHRRGDLLPLRLGYELREFFDWLAHACRSNNVSPQRTKRERHSKSVILAKARIQVVHRCAASN